MYKHDANNHDIEIANRMLAESNSHNMRKLVIGGMDAIPLELITYTGLTHLLLSGPTNADDVMGLIHKLPHLVSLQAGHLTLADAQTVISIPECTECGPMAPLDTQIKRLDIQRVGQEGSLDLALSILRYLLLRIPTLKSVTAPFAPEETIQAFIDKHVQRYPHLANIRFDCAE
ncbi:hypothetical protein H4R19_003525 [Coemansia spiralis]|nr:hypothetical protein H4R19_003525 [Coemansia spiralis]